MPFYAVLFTVAVEQLVPFSRARWKSLRRGSNLPSWRSGLYTTHKSSWGPSVAKEWSGQLQCRLASCGFSSECAGVKPDLAGLGLTLPRRRFAVLDWDIHCFYARLKTLSGNTWGPAHIGQISLRVFWLLNIYVAGLCGFVVS